MEKIQNKNQLSPLYIGQPINVGAQDADPDGLLANGISKKSSSITDVAYPVKKEDPGSGDISILPTNPVPQPLPGPKTQEEKIILENINYARALAKGTDFFRAPSRDQLYKALEKVTGEPLTDERKASIDKFLDAIAHDKPADVDGTGGTGLNDILSVWKTGTFTPVGWDPVNDPGEDDGLPDHPTKPPVNGEPEHPTKPPVGVEPRPTPNKPVPDPTFGPKPNPIWDLPGGSTPISPYPNKPGKESDYPIVY